MSDFETPGDNGKFPRTDDWEELWRESDEAGIVGFDKMPARDLGFRIEPDWEALLDD